MVAQSTKLPMRFHRSGVGGAGRIAARVEVELFGAERMRRGCRRIGEP